MKLTHEDLIELCNRCDSALKKLDIIAEYGNKAEKRIVSLILNNSKNKSV